MTPSSIYTCIDFDAIMNSPHLEASPRASRSKDLKAALHMSKAMRRDRGLGMHHIVPKLSTSPHRERLFSSTRHVLNMI